MRRSRILAAILGMLALAAVTAQEPATPISFFADASPEALQTIKASRDLQGKGLFSQAWNILGTFDPDNSNGFVLAEKIRLAVEASVANGMMVSFGFVDLKEGQTIEELRENPPDEQNIVDFNPWDAIKKLEESGEAVPPVLSYEMGNYLYVVNKDFGEAWMEDPNTVQTSAVEFFDRALSYNVFTPASIIRQSELLEGLEQYAGAENVLKKGMDAYPEIHRFKIQLAGLYNNLGRFDEVYSLVEPVIAKTTDDDEKYNAYIEGIKAGLNTMNQEKLDRYMDGLELAFPTEYVPLLIRHLVAVRLNQPENAAAAAEKVTEKYQADPNIVRSLLSTWLNADEAQAGFDYLNRMLEKHTDDRSMGTLLFYRALMYAETAVGPADLQKGLDDLDAAAAKFVTVYEPGSPVFQTIEQLKAEWKQAIEGASQQSQPDAESAASETYEEGSSTSTDATSSASE
ncbi:MAG: hypothetical protein QHH01_00310 [Spirochaetales bacterium]|nr:hypothetical protein [Spirochaetales bacterium]